MDHRSPAFEATLLYQDGSMPDVMAHDSDFARILAENGETLQSIERIDSVFFLITGAETKILVALGNEALPLDGFLEAGRPSVSALHENEILNRLTQVGSHMTVIALPKDPNASFVAARIEAMLQGICWELVACLFLHARPDLVFWADTDTLYADEEFERASLFKTAEAEALLVGCAPTPPQVPKTNLRSFFDRSEEEPVDVHSKQRPEPRGWMRYLSISGFRNEGSGTVLSGQMH